MRGATKCAFLIFICLAILLFGVGGAVTIIFMALLGLLEVPVMSAWHRRPNDALCQSGNCSFAVNMSSFTLSR